MTLVQDDPTWALEYAHFKSLWPSAAQTDLSNDIWLNRCCGGWAPRRCEGEPHDQARHRLCRHDASRPRTRRVAAAQGLRDALLRCRRGSDRSAEARAICRCSSRTCRSCSRNNRARITFTAERRRRLRECDVVYVALDVPTDDQGQSDLAGHRPAARAVVAGTRHRRRAGGR